MTGAHTPGPWIVNGPHDAPWVCTADHRTILPETMAEVTIPDGATADSASITFCRAHLS